MPYRALGRTGVQTSELSVGTAQLRANSDVESILAFAFDRGINAIELEAGSVAEALAGEFGRQGIRARGMHIFSRVRPLVPLDLPAPHLHADFVYPGAEIRAQTEASLRTLGVERLACQLIHAWCPEWLNEGDWLKTLVRLRDEGKVAAIGVSLFDHDLDSGLAAAASGAIDCIEVMYNLFDQGAADALLPLCHQRGIGVIVRSPLYFGALSPRIHDPEPFEPGDWRRDYFFDEHLDETRGRLSEVEREVEPPDQSLAEFGIRFAISHPAVSTVAVGVSSPQHLDASIAAINRGPLSPAKLERLQRYRWLC